MKKTKIVAVAAATLMAATAAGALAGCGGDPAYTISVKLLCNYRESRFYTTYFEDLEDELKAEGLNYSIDFSFEDAENYYDALDTAIVRGDTPDIFYIRPNEIIKYYDDIVCLQDYAETQTEVDLSGIQDMALNLYRYNPTTGEFNNPTDDLYAFPKDLSTQQLGYNKTFLTKYTEEFRNADIQFPWEGDYATGAKTYTWEQYKKICDIITKSDKRGKTDYAMDVPPIEVLVNSYGGELIDLSQGKANGKIADLSSANGAMNKALKYQAELVAAGAHHADGYSNFTGNHLGFYGLIGSWEIGEHNEHAEANEYEWGVMPWPTVDGSANWKGIITSAGYVVSKNCVENAENPEKGDVAKRIAISFLTSAAQNELVREQQLSLPLIKDVEASYRDPNNDSIYSPKTRGFFLDVVTGKNGFVPAEYLTYNSEWLTPLQEKITSIVNSTNPVNEFNSINWSSVQQEMQEHYDLYKTK